MPSVVDVIAEHRQISVGLSLRATSRPLAIGVVERLQVCPHAVIRGCRSVPRPASRRPPWLPSAEPQQGRGEPATRAWRRRMRGNPAAMKSGSGSAVRVGVGTAAMAAAYQVVQLRDQSGAVMAGPGQGIVGAHPAVVCRERAGAGRHSVPCRGLQGVGEVGSTTPSSRLAVSKGSCLIAAVQARSWRPGRVEKAFEVGDDRSRWLRCAVWGTHPARPDRPKMTML